MNNRLGQQQQAEPIRATRPQPPTVVMPPRRRSMKFWLTLGALIFGLYVFGGQFVLREELQWATISGQLLGTSEKAATTTALPLRVQEAAQTTTAAETAKIAPTLDIERGRAAIDIERQAALAQIEIDKQAAIARQLARIDVAKQADIVKVQAESSSRQMEAEAYQSCLARARAASDAAGSDGSLAAQLARRVISYSTAAELCEERVKTQQDTARDLAEAVAYPDR
jgi:hypothetical protein